jgi:hypothetical protein
MAIATKQALHHMLPQDCSITSVSLTAHEAVMRGQTTMGKILSKVLINQRSSIVFFPRTLWQRILINSQNRKHKSRSPISRNFYKNNIEAMVVDDMDRSCIKMEESQSYQRSSYRNKELRMKVEQIALSKK